MLLRHANINHSFFETFYGKLKKHYQKNWFLFYFFIKYFLKYFTNIYPKEIH